LMFERVQHAVAKSFGARRDKESELIPLGAPAGEMIRKDVDAGASTYVSHSTTNP
jgi:hypothetical protein